MKALSTILLTLLMSMGAWAEWSPENQPEYFEDFKSCYEAIRKGYETLSEEQKNNGSLACEKDFFDANKFTISYNVIRKQPVQDSKPPKKGLCFGPVGQNKEFKEYCSKQEGWVEQEYEPKYFASNAQKSIKSQEPKPSFLYGLLKAALTGAVEGAIIGSISEPCVPKIGKRKTRSYTTPMSDGYVVQEFHKTEIETCAYPLQLK